MGPIALFDKSFLQSLSVDEAVWFDHFFLANVCPIFYAETQANLAKADCRSISPEQLVARIAEKFPDFSGSPNVFHRTMCTASLLGHDVPLQAQVIRPAGRVGEIGGRRVLVEPEDPESQAFLRWVQRDFDERDREAAARWRQDSHGYLTGDVIEALRKLGVLDTVACPLLTDVLAATDALLGKVSEEDKVWLVNQLFEVPVEARPSVLVRWETAGRPPLSTFWPYAAFILRVELFYHLAVSKGRLTRVHRIDLAYLFYLPFCNFFVSSDWVHRECAPLFLRDDQAFVQGADLKAALKVVDTHFKSLSPELRNQSIHSLASVPPDPPGTLVAQLWDRFHPQWRVPRTQSDAVSTEASWWQRNLGECQRIAESGVSPQEPAGLDAIAQRRTAFTRKGSWWRVPEGMRKKRSPQNIEFHNGATAANVIGRKAIVYLTEEADTSDLNGMPDCEIFEREGVLWVDCAPPLERRFVARAPDGASIASSRDRTGIAVFVDTESDLGQLVRRQWATRGEK